MPVSRCRRAVGAFAVAMAVIAATLSVASPASAFTTPVIDGVTPQVGPTAGGTAVRIYGSNFVGTTAVKFGTLTLATTKWKVIDDHLITAVAPAAVGGAADNNKFVDVSVTANGLIGTFTQAYFYSNATLSVSPSSGLVDGQTITVQLTGYAPNTGVVLVEFNPLLLYVEQFPTFPFGPPPYAGYPTFPTTDANGNATVSYAVKSGASFNGNNGKAYDANVACPVNQVTADYLGNSTKAGNPPAYSGKCMIGVGQYGMATMETPITFASGEPIPAPPVLNLSATSAQPGQTVTIATGSKNWNANPFYGSSKAFTKPGETKTVMKLCGFGGSASNCSTTVGNATVSLTRYFGNTNPTPPPTIVGAFSGATATGSIVVGSDKAAFLPCTTCFVKVDQTRPDGTAAPLLSQERSITINP